MYGFLPRVIRSTLKRRKVSRSGSLGAHHDVSILVDILLNCFSDARTVYYNSVSHKD